MAQTRIAPAVLGLDMGGTHTDAVIVQGGEVLASVKVPTNHADLLASTGEALERLFARSSVQPAAISRATFGTTLAINAVVQDACPPVGVIISAGPGLDPMWFGLGTHVFQMPGSVDHRGTELVAPDREALRTVIRQWKAEGLAAFACVGKFSVRNPDHENSMAEVIREVFAGESPVISLGHRLSGALNFPRRIATTTWNAAIAALHGRFADAVEASLRARGVEAPAYLLKADGGAMPFSASRLCPVEALLSGPAASVMGILALNPPAEHEDVLILDMGGTTTDIAVLAGGQPVLSPEGLVVRGRSTLVRSLKSLSIGLGGDSQVTLSNTGVVSVGPKREDRALAFGGTHGPTLLDCLNVLGHARAGDVAASWAGLASLGEMPAEAVASEALERARELIGNAVRGLLAEVNSRPVYTLAALFERRAIQPARAVLVGGPAEAMAPLLGTVLGCPVAALGEPVGAVANAIGAALTRPTASLELFADTATGVLLAGGVQRHIPGRYGLREAREEACRLLREQVAEAFPDSEPEIDVVEEQVFATLEGYGTRGKDIRVRCQLRPGIMQLCRTEGAAPC